MNVNDFVRYRSLIKINLSQFLQEALNKDLSPVDAAQVVPLRRWDLGFEEEKLGYLPTRFSMFLQNVSLFDRSVFGISENEAAIMDPQHRLLLECSYDALHHAGVQGANVQSAGVFVVSFFRKG